MHYSTLLQRPPHPFDDWLPLLITLRYIRLSLPITHYARHKTTPQLYSTDNPTVHPPSDYPTVQEEFENVM